MVGSTNASTERGKQDMLEENSCCILQTEVLRKTNENEELAESGKKAMYSPRWLDEDAKKEWRRLAPILIQEGLLTEKTYNSFASYCQEWSRYQKQQALINQKGALIAPSA